MRIALVDNLLIEQNGSRVEAVLQPHLGLISLASVLRSAGHDVRLYDPKVELADGSLRLDRHLYRQMARSILKGNPDIVGLTSLGCNFICTLKVAQHLRALVPSIPILLGGPHATILHREIIERYSAFDVVIRHEAEATLPAVVAGLSNGVLTGIPGITYRSAREVCVNPGAPLIDCLDSLPMPSYEDYPIEKLRLEWLRVEAGRGCPFMCTFCSTASFFGRQYRLKSAPRLCLELDQLHDRYGIRHFSLQHDLFTVSREKVMEFCGAVAPRRYAWKCSARMDCVDPVMLREMARAGCEEIYFGIETGSPHLQQVSEKRLDLSLFYPTLDVCTELGIRPTVSFITGYPQERAVDQAATLDLVGSCFYRSPPPANVQLHLMTPEPGTQLLDDFRDRLEFDGHISDFTFPTLEDDDEDVMAGAPDVFMNNHYFLAELPRRRHVLVTTLYYVLYDLSPSVLSYLIDQFEGRLSCLVDAFDTWAQNKNIVRASAQDLVSFCRARFGSHDPTTSLVRYMTALASMVRPSRRRFIGGATHGGSARRPVYALNAQVRILRDIHNCPELLEQLGVEQRARSAAEAQASDARRTGEVEVSWRRGMASPRLLAKQVEHAWTDLVTLHRPVQLCTQGLARGTFLVVPLKGTDRVQNLPLDRPLESFLQLFRRPRSLGDFRGVTSKHEAGEMISSLVEIGALTMQ